MIFFAVFLCHIEPTCQKLRFYNQKCEFSPLGPFSLRTGKRQYIPLRTYIVREWPTKVLASRFFSVAKVKIISKKQPNRDPKAKTVKKKNAIEKRKKKILASMQNKIRRRHSILPHVRFSTKKACSLVILLSNPTCG